MVQPCSSPRQGQFQHVVPCRERAHAPHRTKEAGAGPHLWTVTPLSDHSIASRHQGSSAQVRLGDTC